MCSHYDSGCLCWPPMSLTRANYRRWHRVANLLQAPLPLVAKLPPPVSPAINVNLGEGVTHSLNMELDPKVYLGSMPMSRDVHSCTNWLSPATPPPPHLDSYRRALLVSQDRQPSVNLLPVSHRCWQKICHRSHQSHASVLHLEFQICLWI